MVCYAVIAKCCKYLKSWLQSLTHKNIKCAQSRKYTNTEVIVLFPILSSISARNGHLD